jgi:hypothetical protein
VSEPTFFEIQRAFTRYLRDPEHVSPPPHIAPERLAIYTHAVIANAEMFIGDNFPRIKSVMPADTWSALVRDYFRRHESHTPLFVELPGQFLRYRVPSARRRFGGIRLSHPGRVFGWR